MSLTENGANNMVMPVSPMNGGYGAAFQASKVT